MAFDGTLAHRLDLQNALRTARYSGRRIDQLAKDMEAAGLSVSRSHLNAFHNADLTTDPRDWAFKPLEKLYRFLSTNPEYQGLLGQGLSSLRPDSYFFSAAYRYFQTPINREYSFLKSMVGSYAMFRPLWSSPLEGHFVRSVVYIEQSGDAFLIREEQHYEDPHFVKVDETSVGYLFFFGSMVFTVTNENDHQCRRFMCLHSFLPTINGKGAPVEKFDGDLRSISPDSDGLAMNSFRCRRIRDDKFDSFWLKGSELLLEDQKYFGLKNERNAVSPKRKRP